MVNNSNFPIVVAGSILDCSIWQLSEKLTSALHGGLQHLHLDIIDGRFAPRITYGVQMIQDLHQRFPTLSITCHFMVDLILIKDLNRYFFPYLLSPAQTLIVQLASFSDEQQIEQFLNLKKTYAIRLGLAIALPILLKDYQKWLFNVDVLVLMSVTPGRGGQRFDKRVLAKIKVLHAFLTKHHLPVEIQVDGGIKLEEALLCTTAGATVVVMGSFLFQNTLLPQTVLQRLKKHHE